MTLGSAQRRVRPGRTIHGISAVLLPFDEHGSIAWEAFERLLERTAAAGLDVAVNMDTGFGDLLAPPERAAVLDATRSVLGGDRTFYAGAYPDPEASDPLPGYRDSVAAIAARGATPVIVQSRVMHAMDDADKAALYRAIATLAGQAVAFELGPVFAPHGEIWSDEFFARILDIPEIVGAKHSSLERSTELRRLAARDDARPEFRVYTGNDLAIDMIAFGSDYLLGLSTFTPTGFARRDAAFAADDVAFLERNDALQHLGNVGFRTPVPAYKHAAAMYLHLTGVLESDHIHPRAAHRLAADRVLLFDCALRLGEIDDPERIFRQRVARFL